MSGIPVKKQRILTELYHCDGDNREHVCNLLYASLSPTEKDLCALIISSPGATAVSLVNATGRTIHSVSNTLKGLVDIDVLARTRDGKDAPYQYYLAKEYELCPETSAGRSLEILCNQEKF